MSEVAEGLCEEGLEEGLGEGSSHLSRGGGVYFRKRLEADTW